MQKMFFDASLDGMGERARKMVRTEFSWGDISKKLSVIAYKIQTN